MKLLIDTNEPHKMLRIFRIVNAQYEFGMDIEKRTLEIGDYNCIDEKSLVGNICIERKKSDDFVGSVMDGRLFKQAIDMKEFFDVAVIIIVGDISKAYIKSNIENGKWGALAALVTKYAINVLHVSTEEVFAYTVLQIFKQCQTEVNLSKIRKPQISHLGREIGAVSCAKGVGDASAERVLQKFKIRDLAKIKDPKIIADKIERVGLGKAKNIINLFQGFKDRFILTDADIGQLKYYIEKVKRFNKTKKCNRRNLKQLKIMTELLKSF